MSDGHDSAFRLRKMRNHSERYGIAFKRRGEWVLLLWVYIEHG